MKASSATGTESDQHLKRAARHVHGLFDLNSAADTNAHACSVGGSLLGKAERGEGTLKQHKILLIVSFHLVLKTLLFCRP